MQDKKFKNGIEEIKKITMTNDEKNRILLNVLNSPVVDRAPIRSPWSFYFFIKKNSLVYYVVIPLIFILTSGGIVFASEVSLPSSILYPIKVGVVEPVRGALIVSKEVKAYYESNLATERLVEAEILATKGKLDPAKEQQINILLSKHSKKLNETLDKIDQTNGNEKVDEIVTNFQAKMNAHAKVLDIITAQQEQKNKEDVEKEKNLEDNTPRSDTSTVLETIDVDINTLEISDTKEVIVVEDKKENQISKSARTSANIIGNKLRNDKEDRKDTKRDIKNKISEDDKSDKYEKKKESVKSLIDTTTININNKNTLDHKSEVKQKIIDDTNKTINEAIHFLDEANKKEEEGNKKDAYRDLLDSESSIKEAHIFLDIGLKLGEEE